MEALKTYCCGLLDEQGTACIGCPDVPTRTPTPRVKSNGGSTDYYVIPAGARDLQDLIEYKKMGFGIGNIFKACYRLGEKSGTDEAYDLNKIVFFAQRRLEALALEKPV